MKIGCSSVVYRQYELDRALEAIKRNGYDYFETQAVGPWCDHVVLGQDDPIKFAEKAKSYGLGVTGLWTLEGALIPNGDTCVPTVTKAIEWAAAAGIPVVNLGDGYRPKDKMSLEEAFKRLSERVLALVEVAEKNHVIIGLEPHGDFSLTASGLQKILTITDSANFGINYDCGNIHGYGHEEEGAEISDENIEVRILRKIADRVVHFHAKDIDENKKCKALGEGVTDVAGCIEIMKNVGYQGVISYETEGGMEFDVADAFAKQSKKFLDRHVPLC